MADTGGWRRHAPVGARCVAGGALICLSVPPWGWWPLAFAGIAVWDRLVADQPWSVRFRRTWLLVAAWLFPSMLWMFDLTPPGYVIACVSYAAYFGLTVALAPPSGWVRWMAFPAAILLAEQARWSFPFGGVPLATIPESQAAQPLAQVVRVAGPLLLVAVTVVGAMALAAAWKRRWKPAGIAVAAIAAVFVVAVVAPDGSEIDAIDVALVQGGGPQRTRAADTDEAVVFGRHVDATDLITAEPDLILWPENVVNIEGPIEQHEWFPVLQQIARDHGAVFVVGVVEGVDEEHFLNAAIAFGPDGSLIDRFDKVRIVPFGEYVPARGLLESVVGEGGLPSRDVIAGDGPGILDTPLGPLGTQISWEIFFANRGREAARHGAVVQLNPTNGASYWLTQVQTQQVASSRLRALESGRWVVQSAPTGFTAIVTPDGRVVDRTGISERRVVEGTIGLRTGDTWATVVGHWPMFLLALAAYPVAWTVARRDDTSVTDVGGGG